MSTTRLSKDLVAFAESGVTVVVGTRNAENVPDCVFAAGLRVREDGACVRFYLPDATGAANLENLRRHRQVAIVLSRPGDYRTVQLKGQVTTIEPARDDERDFVHGYRNALATNLVGVGFPQEIGQRITVWPCSAIEVAIGEIFDQTPGPNAGAPIVSL